MFWQPYLKSSALFNLFIIILTLLLLLKNNYIIINIIFSIVIVKTNWALQKLNKVSIK